MDSSELAPFYYLSIYDGGWNKTQEEGLVLINFPIVDTSGIQTGKSQADATVVGCYSIGGQALSTPKRGLNIMKMSDGRTVKVMVK